MTTTSRTERGVLILDLVLGVVGAAWTLLPALTWPIGGDPVGSLAPTTASALAATGTIVLLAAVVVRILAPRLPRAAPLVAAGAVALVAAGQFAGVLAGVAMTSALTAALFFTLWFAGELVRTARRPMPPASRSGRAATGGS